MRKIIALLVFLTPSFVLAQLDPSETGLEVTGEEAYGTVDQNISAWVGDKIITPALSVVGVIFLVLMIYAGFLWMTAGGEKNKIEKARDIMIRAVIGVVIITAAYAITAFVFSALS